jgi:2-polyprenyl-3-methyl-5-hydroxy-6-metoxy-1,4-benzoquinol methylase
VKIQERPEFDQYASRYEEALRHSMPDALEEDSYFAEYKIQYMARQICNDEMLQILDYGCGVGRSLDILEKYFPKAELWGYDVSEQSIEVARQRTERTHLTSNFEKLPLDSFDIILAANVFHHIPPESRLDALEYCKSLLKPGGRLFIFEHNPINPLTRMIFERCPYDQDATMLRRQEVFALANAASFTVAKSNYTLFFPKQLSLLRFIERHLGWLALGAQYCVEMEK